MVARLVTYEPVPQMVNDFALQWNELLKREDTQTVASLMTSEIAAILLLMRGSLDEDHIRRFMDWLIKDVEKQVALKLKKGIQIQAVTQ